MIQYISLAVTALFMGFIPISDIYVAIPSTMALGLGVTCAVLWSSLGSFISIPIIGFFYERLSRYKKINQYFQKLSNSKFASKMKKKGVLFIALAMPMIGSMTVGVLGKVVGMDKRKLFIASGLSIAVYGSLMGVLTTFGLTAFFA